MKLLLSAQQRQQKLGLLRVEQNNTLNPLFDLEVSEEPATHEREVCPWREQYIAQALSMLH